MNKEIIKFINTNNLLLNAKYFKQLCNKEKIYAVVKSNAYGHSLKHCIPTLNNIVDGYAVASNLEALKLKKLTEKPIVVIGAFSTIKLKKCIENNIQISIKSRFEALKIIKISNLLNFFCKVHIIVNSGMNRLGVSKLRELKQILHLIEKNKYVQIVGIFSHIGGSDSNSNRTQEQFKKFLKFRNLIPNIPAHIVNTENFLKYPEMRLDISRIGIGLYGFGCNELLPVMTIKAKIINILNVKKDSFIGYGTNFKVNKNSKLAVVSIGYANGLMRTYAKKGYFLINDKKAKICANICMNMTIVDISNIEKVKIGDYATILGTDNKKLSVNFNGTAILGNLKAGINVSGTFRNFNEPHMGASGFMNYTMRSLPVMPEYTEDGRYGRSWLTTPGQNTFFNLTAHVNEGMNNYKQTRLLGSIFAEYSLPFDIKYKLTMAVNKYDEINRILTPIVVTYNPKTLEPQKSTNEQTVKNYSNNNIDPSLFQTLSWNKKIKDAHDVALLLGMSYEEFKKQTESESEVKRTDHKERFVVVNGKTYKFIKDDAYFRISCTKMAQDLIKWGCVIRKTDKLEKIPDIPKDLIRYFILGFYDGDGIASVGEQSHYMGFCGTFKMMESISLYLHEELGLPLLEPYYNKNNKIYYIQYSTKERIKTLFNYFYTDLEIPHLIRKEEKIKKYLEANTEEN